jgi:serine/threonine-protein kinase
MGNAGVDAAAVIEATSTVSGSSLVSRARTRIGSTLREKWRLDALLGVGGMAAVYAATHRNGRRAALKILHPELSLELEWRTRFLREGRVANAVPHDGALKVLDDDVTEDGSVFLVLELLEGESVEERLRRHGGPLPEKEVLWIADQVLDVLVAAHARGVIHRDIKPDNLFLTSTGSLKVLDFGIARLRELSRISAATHSGGTMGTPAFMAPEQARGLWDEVDVQSDLFSVGATMFTLLSGQNVHKGRSQNEEILSAMTVPPRPLSSAAPSVAPAVARVVDRALAFEKGNRWPSAQEMRDAVSDAYRDGTGRRISMAPRPVVPDVSGTGDLVLSRDMSLPEPAAPAVAKATVEWRWGRTGGLAAAVAAGAAAVIAIAVALARPGYSPQARAAASAAQEPSVPSPPAAPAGSPIADVPPSSRSEPPPVAASVVHAASAPAVAQKAPSAPKPPAKPDCSTPFVVDPATHIKHWRIDCL